MLKNARESSLAGGRGRRGAGIEIQPAILFFDFLSHAKPTRRETSAAAAPRGAGPPRTRLARPLAKKNALPVKKKTNRSMRSIEFVAKPRRNYITKVLWLNYAVS